MQWRKTKKEKKRKNPHAHTASHWDSCAKWNTWRLHVASHLQGYSILIRVLETSFIRLSLISPTHHHLNTHMHSLSHTRTHAHTQTHTQNLLSPHLKMQKHSHKKKKHTKKKEKRTKKLRKKRFYGLQPFVWYTHNHKSNELGPKALSHFILEKKPLPLLFNCIFFGAKVIINFAQGDTHEPLTIILK